jgi:hypothetical protein
LIIRSTEGRRVMMALNRLAKRHRINRGDVVLYNVTFIDNLSRALLHRGAIKQQALPRLFFCLRPFALTNRKLVFAEIKCIEGLVISRRVKAIILPRESVQYFKPLALKGIEKELIVRMNLMDEWNLVASYNAG